MFEVMNEIWHLYEVKDGTLVLKKLATGELFEGLTFEEVSALGAVADNARSGIDR